jgi:nucleoside-specific outer membrane channel protein Tsx
VNKTATILLSLLVTLLLICAQSALAEETENYFMSTELQLHLDFDREPYVGEGIYTVTLEHFSEWKYGDNYFFVDAEGQSNYSMDTETIYYEIAPRLSIDRILGSKVISLDNLGETYLTVQYNRGGEDYINPVWLSGVSVDFNFQPNYGFSNLSIMVRNEETQDTAYQITLVWGQPFQLFGQQFAFNGFADYWQNDECEVFLTEPQLRYNLSSLFGSDSLMSTSVIGTEIEISHDFFSEDADWQVNPTLFFAFSF